MASIQRPTNRQHSQPNILVRFLNRIQHSIQLALARGDLATMMIVFGLLFMPILASHAADWTDGLLWLLPIAGLSAALGYFLALSRLSELTAMLISMMYGFAVIAFVAIFGWAESGSIADRITSLGTRLNAWITALNQNTPSTDPLPLILVAAVLTWTIAHNTIWHIFRIDRVWRAVIPPGLILVTNNFFYLEDSPLDVFLIVYMFLSLLLIVRSHVDAREYEWYRNKVRYPRQMRPYFLRVGAGLSILFVLVAWILPAGQDPKNLDRIETFLNSLAQLSENWDDLFSSLESQGVSSAEYYGGDRLEMGGAIDLGDRPVLEIEVSAPPRLRYYWRSTVFDTYIAGGWEHKRSVRATKDDDGLRLNIGTFAPDARQTVHQEIEMQLTTSSLIYAAPQPVEFGLPVRVELDCIDNPAEFECVNRNGQTDMAISRAIDPLRAGKTYSVQSSVSVASANALRAAGTDYPAWVVPKYLQGTEQVTPRLRDLTLQIIASAGATTPYDKAKAIERWLRENIAYEEAIPEPPIGQDRVDWFVFDLRRGYCNYYAAAMILMLRSEGVPARLAAGFSQGESIGNNTYLVRENDAHTWVEVYFPNYGWVEFEPTADEDSLDREGDQLPPTPEQTPTPLPTTTPTPTPTLTPEPLQDNQASQPTPTQQQNEQPIPPTETVTPTPTMTPPAPQQETEVDSSDEDRPWLKYLLYALAFLFLLAVVTISAVAFLIWYVEHRGLHGLSLTEKAYARMAIYGRWLGIRLPEDHTPEERRQDLIEEVPEGEQPITDITQLYVEERFAPPREASETGQEAGKAWNQARLAFIRRKFEGWFRWR